MNYSVMSKLKLTSSYNSNVRNIYKFLAIENRIISIIKEKFGDSCYDIIFMIIEFFGEKQMIMHHAFIYKYYVGKCHRNRKQGKIIDKKITKIMKKYIGELCNGYDFGYSLGGFDDPLFAFDLNKTVFNHIFYTHMEMLNEEKNTDDSMHAAFRKHNGYYCNDNVPDVNFKIENVNKIKEIFRCIGCNVKIKYYWVKPTDMISHMGGVDALMVLDYKVIPFNIKHNW